MSGSSGPGMNMTGSIGPGMNTSGSIGPGMNMSGSIGPGIGDVVICFTTDQYNNPPRIIFFKMPSGVYTCSCFRVSC